MLARDVHSDPNVREIVMRLFICHTPPSLPLSPRLVMRTSGCAGCPRQLFTVMAGAFNLKTGETWASAASTMLAVCSLTMSCTTLAAMYYIEDTVAKKRKELEQCAPPPDGGSALPPT